MGGFGYQAPPAAPCPPAAQGQRPAGTLTPPSPESIEGVSAVASGPAEEGADLGARDWGLTQPAREAAQVPRAGLLVHQQRKGKSSSNSPRRYRDW